MPRLSLGGINMRRRDFVGLVACSAALTWPFPARTQQAEKVPRVAFLGPQSRTSAPMADYYRAFSSQLEKNGFREGQNIIVDYRAIDDPRGPFVGAAELLRAAGFGGYRWPRGRPASSHRRERPYSDCHVCR